MTAPFVLHGDPAGAVVDILTNLTPELAPYAVVNVATDLKGWQEPQRWVEISLKGGFRRSHEKISVPRIDIAVYGESSSVCSDVINICAASLFRARHAGYRGMGVRLIDVKEETGPFEAHDKHSECPRFVASYRLAVTPDPDSMP